MWASKAAARLENLCCMASAELAAALLSGVVGVDGLATVCSAGAWFSRLLVTVGARAGAIGATGITAVAVSSLATASHATICAARFTHIGPKPNAWLNCIWRELIVTILVSARLRAPHHTHNKHGAAQCV